jgi:spore coat protein U domain-containing protein, fimbrial subunit CupE1/2/3/6
MKKLIAITAVAIVAMAGSAFAATQTTTVAVSATITGACTVTSAGSIAYNSLDPLTGGVVTPTVTQPVVHCTNGLGVAVTDDLGLHEVGAQAYMSNGATGTIPYTFGYAASPTGAGSATPLAINLTGANLATVDYATAPAGTYADTITLTLTF